MLVDIDEVEVRRCRTREDLGSGYRVGDEEDKKGRGEDRRTFSSLLFAGKNPEKNRPSISDVAGWHGWPKYPLTTE